MAAVEKGYTIFKYISMFCFPATVLFGVYVFMNEEHPKRVPFVPYDHMYIMTKPYPWGDGKHTLFFNKKINATIDGYETEEEEH